MEYKIMNEDIREQIKAQFEENSAEWSQDQMKNAKKNYEVDLDRLQRTVAIEQRGLELYVANPKILNPVFAYEADEEYARLLRDSKTPEMEAEINKKLGMIESTVFQLGLMEDALENREFPVAEKEEE